MAVGQNGVKDRNVRIRITYMHLYPGGRISLQQGGNRTSKAHIPGLGIHARNRSDFIIKPSSPNNGGRDQSWMSIEGNI